MTPELQDKYARLWHETNNWEIPHGFEPFEMRQTLTLKEKQVYAEGMWKILHELAKDGLVPQELLRSIHEEEFNRKPGWSRITVR